MVLRHLFFANSILSYAIIERFITDRSKLVLWCPFFGVRVSVTSHLMCVHIIFSSVSVAERSPFEK